MAEPQGKTQPAWWPQTTPWWQVKPTLQDPTTWPIAAPITGLMQGVNGGPNWVPGVSPVLRGPSNTLSAVGQGMVWAGQNTFEQFFKNPTPQAAPGPAPGAAPAAEWNFAPTAAGNSNVVPSVGDVGFIIGPESNNNPNARNPRSSASGLGQFIDQTWMDKDLRKRAGFDQIDDKTWMGLKQGDAGVAAQTAMTQAYAQRNSEQWEKRFSRAPDRGQVYGMHFLDAQPFMYLTESAAANPGADSTKMFPDAAKANPEIFYKDAKKRAQPRSAAELYAEITRRGGGNDPWQMPQLQGVDPRTAMGMIPNPSAPQRVNLPDAPQMGMVAPRPMEEEANIPEAMAMLQQFAPKPFDAQEAGRGRLPAILTGIAQGAANSDGGWGDILANIGAGAGRAAVGFDQDVKRQKTAGEEAERLFGLSLARLNLDMGQDNRGVRNRNADRGWQDSRDKVATEFQNKSSQWETDLKEYMVNNGLENQYIRDLDGARMTRARVGLQAIEAAAELANAQAGGQAQLDLKKYLWQDEKANTPINDAQAKVVQNLLGGIGLDMKMAVANKDLPALNAGQAAHYIASNNKEGAIKLLGREMALTGRLDLLPDGKTKNEIELLAKRDPDAAGEAIGRLLNEGERTDPGSALAWAKVMAANGYPVGQLFLRNVKQATPVAPNAGTQGQPANGGTR